MPNHRIIVYIKTAFQNSLQPMRIRLRQYLCNFS